MAGPPRSRARDPSDPETPFRWRISIAEIHADGPFSHFPCIDRQLVLLDGHGMRLTIDGAETRLVRRFDTVRFDGGANVDCRLLDGPTTDFNLMTRRGAVEARLHVEPGPARRHLRADSSSQWLVHVLDGEARLAVAGRILRLAAGETLWLGGESAERPFAASGAHILVALHALP